MKTEEVLVVQREILRPWLDDIFCTKNLNNLLNLILASHSFLIRHVAENDPSFKQIIPYIVVRHIDKYLLTQRTKLQTETRLHRKFSLGLGGHINPDEGFQVRNIIEAGLERELEEEVHLYGKRELSLIGSINDDSNPVGQVHMGLVYLLETDCSYFTVNEQNKMTAKWAPFLIVQECYQLLETWSQVVFDHVISE